MLNLNTELLCPTETWTKLKKEKSKLKRILLYQETTLVRTKTQQQKEYITKVSRDKLENYSSSKSSGPVPLCTCSIPALAAVQYQQHPLVFHWYNEQVVSHCVAPLEVQQNKNTFRISSVVCECPSKRGETDC